MAKSDGFYFLKSFYSGTKSMTSDDCVKEVEAVINDF